MDIKSRIYFSQFRLRQRLIAARCSVSRNRSPIIDSGDYSPGRVLFVLSGLLGDSVMSSPAIAEAKEIWPKAHISVLGKSHNRDLLSADPNIDEFHVCNADPLSIRNLSKIRDLKRWIAEKDFDTAIILLGDQYAHLLAWAKIPIRIGVKGTLLEPCLTHSYEIGSPQEWGANERLNTLRVLGYQVAARSPKLYVSTEAAETAGKRLSEAGLIECESYLALHPFGSTRRQWWPLENIPQFADKVYRSLGKRTILLGGKETLSPKVNSERIIDMRGLLSIPELLAIIDRAEMVVTTDSGPFHIAGALGKQIIGLFRHRRPEHANAYPTARVVFGEHEACRLRCDWDRCAANPCRQMVAIEPEQAADFL